MKSFFSKKIVVGALVAATVCVSGITDAKAQEFAVQGAPDYTGAQTAAA